MHTIWLNCPGVKALFSLVKTCFSKLSPTETNASIDFLLRTVISQRPHFDWVVIQLGSCFPRVLISKIIGFRLDESAYKPPFDFEVPILAELYLANESTFVAALKHALVDQFLTAKNAKTIPYLMHLCKNSNTLLQPIARAFLELYDEQRITPATFQGLAKDVTSLNLLTLLPSWIMRIHDNGTRILLILAQSADTPFCADLLQQVLRELEALTLDDRQLTGEFPLLIDLLRDATKPKLWQACLSEKQKEQETAVRLLLLISPRTPIVYHQTIAELLKCPQLAEGALVRILNGVYGVSADHLDVRKGIQLSLEMISKNSSKLVTRAVPLLDEEGELETPSASINQLVNMVHLLELEAREDNPNLARKLVTQSLSRHAIKTLLRILEECFKRLHSEVVDDLRDVAGDSERGVKKFKGEATATPEQVQSKRREIGEEIHLLLNILEKVIGEVRFNMLQMSDLLRFAQLAVRCFFWTLTEGDAQQKRVSMDRIMAILTGVCASRKGIRSAAIRDLLEGALVVHRPLFGGPPFQTTPTDGTPAAPSLDSMMRLNQNQDVISGTNRSYLHAGLIGQGVRAAGLGPDDLSPEIKQYFLDAISACCYDQDRAVVTESFTTVSLLLVEFVSPDVMYNGLPWPEEEFQKVTIERDLQIRRTFKHSPILWPLLSLLAVHRPAMCFSSVLLRAICATVMHQWRARSVEKPFCGQVKHPDLMYVTEKLLELMALGQLLPPPLNHLHHVIGQLDPVEVPTVLRDCVWNYMKDNVPSPALFECHPSSGLVWRNPVQARPATQYTDTLRRIMLKKLTTLGSVYHQMFVLPDQQAVK